MKTLSESSLSVHASQTEVEPLRASDRERLANIGARLRGELSAFVMQLPRDTRQPRPLARYLNIDRNITQRALAATHVDGDGLDVLLRISGIRGLRQLIEAAAGTGMRRQEIRALSAVVDQLDHAVQELGGSYIRVLERIRSTMQPAAIAANALESNVPEIPILNDADLAARETLHRGAVEMVGRCSDVHAFIGVCYNSTTKPGTFECDNLTAFVGHQSRPGAQALVLQVKRLVSDNPEEQTGDQTRLIEEFCSTPLPATLDKHLSETKRLTIIDPAATSNGRKIDIAMLRRRMSMPDVRTMPVPELGQMFTIKYPIKHFIFDVYIERSLAMASVP